MFHSKLKEKSCNDKRRTRLSPNTFQLPVADLASLYLKVSNSSLLRDNICTYLMAEKTFFWIEEYHEKVCATLKVVPVNLQRKGSKFPW